MRRSGAQAAHLGKPVLVLINLPPPSLPPFPHPTKAMSSTPAPVTPITLWMLQYHYVSDILDKRALHRAEHLAGLNEAAAEGTMVLGTS